MADDGKLGRLSFEWARAHMPVFVLAEKYIQRKELGKRFFKNTYAAMCLHVSRETAVLVDSLHSLGMEINLVAANPLSTQDNIASFLRERGVEVSAKGSESSEEYYASIEVAAKSSPEFIVDDGGELHVAYSRLSLKSCKGGTDETTSGTLRLRAMDSERKLSYPVIPVNEAETKHIFDNKYGSGQSALDGLLRATGLLIAGKCVVISGYGWVGRGVAERTRGLGARVIVTEVDGVKALEAHMDGYEVLPMDEASIRGDVFLTCTGQLEVLRREHFERMKDGAILGNMGHFDREIDVVTLKKMGRRVEQVRKNVTKIEIDTEKSLYLLCDGRVVNLVAAGGHPPEVMQLSFANQLLSIYYLLEHEKELRRERPKLLQFPKEIDALVTNFALEGFQLKIDRLSQRQKNYTKSY